MHVPHFASKSMAENDFFPSPIITPSTKASEGHDEDISKENEIAIVWQRPDHEGFLCRHFEHLRDRQILNKREATSTLEVAWPNYEKNQTAIQIQKILSIKHVLGAADTLPEFKRLLAAIGFLED